MSKEPIVITKQAYVALQRVLVEFASRADAGQAARDALSDFVHEVLEVNPGILED